MGLFLLFLGSVSIIIGANALRSQKLFLSKEAFYYVPIDNILKAIMGEKVPKYTFTGLVKNIISLLFIIGGISFIYEAYIIYKTGVSPI